jgi:hypothetical protein
MFWPCGGHHQLSTTYWSCQYIKDILSCDMIYIYLTAVGLTPGGSSTSHIYTRTVHKKHQYITHLHTNSTHNTAVHHAFTHKQYTQHSSTVHIYTQTVHTTQQYIKHLHTNSTHYTEIGKLGSAGRAPSLPVISWNLHYSWGKSTENHQLG